MITWDHVGEPPHEDGKSYLCWCFFKYKDRPVERAIVLTWEAYDWYEAGGKWEWDDGEEDFWGSILCWSEITAPVFEVKSS